jgi:hypothetical protein
MKRTETAVLESLLMIGVVVLWAQLSAGRGLVFVPEPSQAERTAERLNRRNDRQKDVHCRLALKNAPEIKVGMRASEVLDLLGEPGARLENEWVYNFFECMPPPQVGQQLLAGLDIIFNDGVIKEIKYASVDATGPAPAKKTEKKRSRKSAKRVIAGAVADKFID